MELLNKLKRSNTEINTNKTETIPLSIVYFLPHFKYTNAKKIGTAKSK